MKIVFEGDKFVESALGAQREAATSFGVNTLLIEKYITQPRHIEVQVCNPGFFFTNISAYAFPQYRTCTSKKLSLFSVLR